MSTLVCFHAHPDDEALATGGLMAKAAAAGHRVVLVCATRGEQGEPKPGVLADGEQLWERRWQELTQACKILGAEPPRWLGYEDSGMAGEASNDNPECFWQADVEEATDRFATIVDEVGADVVTIYDAHGGYGHPDHIMVHRVGKAGAAQAGVGHVFEATFCRENTVAIIEEQMAMAIEAAKAAGIEPPDFGDFDPHTSGTPLAQIVYRIDVRAHREVKRAAILAHRSQVSEDDPFLAAEASGTDAAEMMGYEWFSIPDVDHHDGPTEVDLLPGLS